jgi:hypothetical protein
VKREEPATRRIIPSMIDASLGQLQELERLQAHFMWVLALLRAQNHDEKSAEWKESRARTLELLERYSDAGRFPRNEIATDAMVPVFIDRHGTTCAVAELMSWTGHVELAERLHRTMNFSYVDEMLQQLPEELARWGELAGLSAAEIALIQPSYCPVKSECYECCYNEPFPEEGTACEPYTYPDGEPCCTDEYCGVCKSAQCVLVSSGSTGGSGGAGTGSAMTGGSTGGSSGAVTGGAGTGGATTTGGCAVPPDGPATGSVAPLLAALFLLYLRRRVTPLPETGPSPSRPGPTA